MHGKMICRNGSWELYDSQTNRMVCSTRDNLSCCELGRAHGYRVIDVDTSGDPAFQNLRETN